MSFEKKIRIYNSPEELEIVIAKFKEEGYRFRDNAHAIEEMYQDETGGVRGDEFGILTYGTKTFYEREISSGFFYTDYRIIEFEDEQPVKAPTSPSSDKLNPKAALGMASLPMTRLSPLACAVGALGKLNGALKYGTSNYIGTQVVMSIYLDAIRRHFDAILMGEDCDPIDGVPHWGAIMANIDIILSAQAAGTLIDDRPRADGQLEALRALKPLVASLQELHKDKNPKHYYLKDKEE